MASEKIEHTPGPWHLVEIEGKLCPTGADYQSSLLTIVDEDGVKFAAVYSDADAHLIAAAPDLLKLAKLVHGSFGGGRIITFSDADIQSFEAAIAKATGAS